MNSWLACPAGVGCEPLKARSLAQSSMGRGNCGVAGGCVSERLEGSGCGEETVKASRVSELSHAAPVPGQQSGWSSDAAGHARQCQAPGSPARIPHPDFILQSGRCFEGCFAGGNCTPLRCFPKKPR